MPANLPPQYVKIEEEYRREREPRRRLELLQMMLREIPKHKGTDHLQGELKSKISKLKAEIESPKKAGASRLHPLDHIPREGAGQIVLIGPANSGKSSIVGALTHAPVEIAEWPFATRKPVPGMAAWENVKLQLVDTPSIAEEYCENYVFNIARTGDVVVLVVSLADDDVIAHYEYVVKRVHEGKVRLGGLAKPDDALPTAVEKRTIVAATGCDNPGAASRLELLEEIVGSQAPLVTLSIPQRRGLDHFLETAFKALGLLRVYTKAPGQKPDLRDPVLLPHGGTVADAARAIHKEIAEKLLHARLWSAENKAMQGVRVPADHTLQEGDVIEFHV